MREYTLSEEQNNLVLKNQGLVHYFVKRLDVPSSNYDDLVSIGTIGLIKASRTFDKSKGIAFATYASRCINNEIFMFFRKENINSHILSLDDVINEDSNGNELTLKDSIPASDMDFVEDIETLELFTRCINIILNVFSSKERFIMLSKIAGVTQHCISEILKISQSYISRLEKRAIQKLKLYLTDTQQFKEVFSMTMENGLYRISFSSKDVKNFNKIFANLLQNLSLNANLPDFKVSCSNGRTLILLPANLSSFSFVAQIIQEIDDYSMTYVSDANMPKLTNNTTESNTIVSGNVEAGESTEDTQAVTGAEHHNSPIANDESETIQTSDEAASDSSPDTGNPETIQDSEDIESTTSEVDSDSAPDTGNPEAIQDSEDVDSTTSEVDSDSAPDAGNPEAIQDSEDVDSTTSEVDSDSSPDTGKPEAIQDSEDIESTTSEVDSNSSPDINKPDSIKSSKSTITVPDIRNYFMELDRFTTKELKKVFPNCETTVRNAIYLAKNSGLIKSTETRGEYLVIAKSQKAD